MEALTIKSPADLLSFIGHSLGFWPHESLVCITVDTNRIGATLRVDLPRHDGGELGYARTVAGYLSHDRNATSVLFAVYTATPWDAGQPKPRAAIIAALTGVLAERGITIPLTATQTSAINAEFIYRGSSIEDTHRITLAPPRRDRGGASPLDRFARCQNLPHRRPDRQPHRRHPRAGEKSYRGATGNKLGSHATQSSPLREKAAHERTAKNATNGARASA